MPRSMYLSPRATTITAYALGFMACCTMVINVWLSNACKELRLEIAALEKQIEAAEKERAANSAKLAALIRKQEARKEPTSLAVVNNNPLNIKARSTDPLARPDG